jgi:hypothetical protein
MDAGKTYIYSSRYPFLANGLLDVTKVSVTIFQRYLPTHNLTASLHYTFWSRRWRWVMPSKYQLSNYYMTTDSHNPGHCSLKAWQARSSQANQYMKTTASKTSSIMTVMTSILHTSLPGSMMLNCNSEYLSFKCMNLNFYKHKFL